jgi:hypothetical protein
MFFTINEYYSIIEDMSAELTGTRKNGSKSTINQPDGVVSCKKESNFLAEENYGKSIIFLRASSTINQSESENEKIERKNTSLNPGAPRSIAGQRCTYESSSILLPKFWTKQTHWLLSSGLTRIR